MGIYRDDLESARLRIQTLQAKLTAAEARADANEAEANELRTEVERLRRELGRREHEAPTLIRRTPINRAPFVLTGMLVTCCSVGAALAFMAHRAAEQARFPSVPIDVTPAATPERPSPPPLPEPARLADPEPAASGAFSRDEARTALAAAAAVADRCPSTVTGRGRVTVTFAPTGEVTSVTIGPPFAASNAAPCLRAAFGGLSVSPFEGGPVTVSKSFFIR